MSFNAPVNSILYLLRHGYGMEELRQYVSDDMLGDELVSDILNGAASFATDVLAPLNRIGDEVGAVLKDGAVTTAPGFKQAYQAYCEAGWQGLSAPQNIGGMGLPQVINVAVNEMLYGANMAFGLCPMLTASALNAIIAHADADLKDKYVSKMVSGKWSGGMNLTEPQAGSDFRCASSKGSSQ